MSVLKNKINIFVLIVLAGLIFINPASAETFNWQPVDYSNPDLIAESGLTVDEFNNLSQNDWLELLGDKEKVNFAFQAINSTGKDITNTINPDLSINVEGLNNNKIVSFFKNNEEQLEETVNNYALSFNGTNANDMVVVPHNQSNYTFYNELTLEAWAYPKTTEEEFRFIINKGDRYNGIVLRHGRTIQNGNSVNVRLEINGVMEELNFYPENPEELDNRWNHYAIVYNGEKLKLYINDILRNEKNASGQINLTSEDMYIGHGNINDLKERWYGYIDEVRLWNVARSPEEIQNDKNKQLTGNEEGLVSYYDMEEGSGSILLDKTGNNDGTIYGAEYILK